MIQIVDVVAELEDHLVAMDYFLEVARMAVSLWAAVSMHGLSAMLAC